MVHEIEVQLNDPQVNAKRGIEETTDVDAKVASVSDMKRTRHNDKIDADNNVAKLSALDAENPSKELLSNNEPPSPRIVPGPTIDGDSIDFPLTAIKEHLICPLCRGYFRDPYTVADCLHSFCRSCLIVYFRVGHRRCPTCDISLEPDPFREVLADRTLQEVVDKIFPWMRKKEEQEEKAFYAARGIQLKPEYATARVSAHSADKGLMRDSNGDKIFKSASPPKNSTSDMIDLQLEPYQAKQGESSLPLLRCPMLRTSGRLKILSIKKYLVQRLGLKEKQSSIEILCNGDPVGNEHSLTFILRTRWFTPKVLTLNYRLVVER